MITLSSPQNLENSSMKKYLKEIMFNLKQLMIFMKYCEWEKFVFIKGSFFDKKCLFNTQNLNIILTSTCNDYA